MSIEPKDQLILCTKENAHGGYALWWRSNRSGYCAEVEHAGRYSKTEARQICFGTSGEAVAVPAQAAAMMARAVVDANTLRDWLRKRKEQGG